MIGHDGMANSDAPPPTDLTWSSEFHWDLALFQVEDTMFQVSRHGFIESSPVFQTIFLHPGDDDQKEQGRTEYNPIVLNGCKASDFEALLKVLYPSSRAFLSGSVALTKDQWVGVLRLSTTWEMIGIREFAIKKLSKESPTLTPVEQVTLGRDHKVASWLVEGLTALTLDLDIPPDDLEEAVGLRSAFRIAMIRPRLSPNAKTIPVDGLRGICIGLAVDDLRYACCYKPFTKEGGMKCDSCSSVPTSNTAGSVYITSKPPLTGFGRNCYIRFDQSDLMCASCHQRFTTAKVCQGCKVRPARQFFVVFGSSSDLVPSAATLVGEVFQDEIEECGGVTSALNLPATAHPLHEQAPIEVIPAPTGTTAPIITQSLPVLVPRVCTGDIVGFGQDGVVIFRNSAPPDTRLVIANYGYNAGGWRVDQHVRLLGDTTGNKRADIIGFGSGGVSIFRNNGDGNFGPQPVVAVNDFGTASGWTNTKHIRYVADLRKKGMVDIIGFGNNGIFVSLNNGDGTFAPAKLAHNDFGYDAGGWRIERHLRFLADTTGDGLPDVIGFGESAVFVATNKGDGTFNASKVVPDGVYSISVHGWSIDRHPRTVADLTGDGRVDIVGFANAGVYVSLNNGDGTFQASMLVVKDFGYDQGWRVEQHPRFIADLNGDGCGDIIGFASPGVLVARNKGDGNFEEPKLALSQFGFDQGWRVDKHPRYLVDLTGDGFPDIIGFGESSVWVSYNDGAGNFASAVKLTDSFAYNGGQWAVDKTVRWVTNLN